MAYVEDRFIHDADSHIMELPGFLDDYVEARFKSAINADASYFGRRPNFLARCRRSYGVRAILPGATRTARRSCSARTGTRPAPFAARIGRRRSTISDSRASSSSAPRT